MVSMGEEVFMAAKTNMARVAKKTLTFIPFISFLVIFTLGFLGVGVFERIFPLILFIPIPLILILGAVLFFFYPRLLPKVLGIIAIVSFFLSIILLGLKVSSFGKVIGLFNPTTNYLYTAVAIWGLAATVWVAIHGGSRLTSLQEKTLGLQEKTIALQEKTLENSEEGLRILKKIAKKIL